jgi:hypothetical protein
MFVKVNLLFFLRYIVKFTASGDQCSEFLAADLEVTGSIPGATRFSEK